MTSYGDLKEELQERSTDAGSSGTGAVTSQQGVSVPKQLGLMVLVVLTGCANNISKQVASVPLRRFSYMIALSTAATYVPFYGAIMLLSMRAGRLPLHQLRFVWRTRARCMPTVLFFAVIGLGDTLGDGIGMICTPYVSGPVHALLGNCTPIFMAMLSTSVLSKRLSLLQCLALCGACSALVVGILPSFMEEGSSSDPFFAVLIIVSCFFNAMAWLTKELLFTRYRTWMVTEAVQDAGKGLNVFLVNSHAALFQLPLTLLCMPLNRALGETNGEDLSQYMRHAFGCVLGEAHSCGSSHGDYAGLALVIYVALNLSFNISILWSVKHCGALATFIALKAIFPTSTVLFAAVDWPLLGRTELSWLIWVSVLLLVPSIGAYQYASKQQEQRAQQRPSQASCCWPLGRLQRSESELGRGEGV